MTLRATKACDFCAKRIKCSGEYPCNQCEAYGRNCSFDLPTKKRGPLKTTGDGIDTSSSRCSSQPETADWNLDQLWTLEIQDRTGNYQSWIGIYYQNVYPVYPLIPESFLRLNFFKLPKELIQTLFSCCAIYSRDSNLFRMHLDTSIQLIDQSLDKPDAFAVLALIHVVVYYILKSEITNALKYLGMLVRLASVMGLFSSLKHTIAYRDMSGFVLESDSQQLCLSISAFVYIHDYYCSVINGFPFMVGMDFYHKYTTDGYESKLTKLVQFARLMQKSKSYLDQRSIKMKDDWDRIGSDLQISSKASVTEKSQAKYLKLFHNYLYVLLVRNSLLDPTNTSHESLKVLENSCDLIVDLVKLNPQLEALPIFFGQLVYSIGLFCLLRKKDLKELDCRFILLKVLGESKLISYQEKALQLEQCLLDPANALEYIQTKVVPNF